MKYGDVVVWEHRTPPWDMSFMVVGHLTGMQLDGTPYGENEVAVLVALGEGLYPAGHVTYATESVLEVIA